MQRKRLRWSTAATVALAAAGVLCGAKPAPSAPATLRDSLKPLAREIVDVIVKDQNQATVVVGDFIGPADLNTNAGPGLTETLKSLLNELQPGIVQRKAALSLRGHYDKVPDPKSPTTLILIKVAAEITDKNARRVDEKFAEIRDTQLLAGLVGATITVPPKATAEAANIALQKAIDTPQFAIEGTKIKTSAESKNAIEILVTSKETSPRDAKDWARVPPRAPRNEGGEAFVDIQRDEVYAIRIHNGYKGGDVASESAIFVTIDGLDIFTFSEIRDPKTRRPKYAHFIVPSGLSTIPGWHKTNARCDSFLVTEYGKGAASGQPHVSRGKVGVITVKFAEVPKPKSYAFEYNPDAPAGGKETGFGPSAKVDMKEISRPIGEVRDIITVRYSK